jgi:hypothetical protein
MAGKLPTTVRRKCIVCGDPYRAPKGTPKAAACCEKDACIDQVTEVALELARKAEFGKRLAKFQETDPYHLAKLESRCQAAFNTMIRALDADKPCPTCGRWDAQLEDRFGGKWDCGHYKTRGAFPEHRFTAINAFRQCKTCNSGSYHHAVKAETVGAAFKEFILRQPDGPAIEAYLAIRHPPWKPTCQELAEMTALFRAETRLLQRGGAPTREWRSLF